MAWWVRPSHEQRHAKADDPAPKVIPQPEDVEIDRQLVALFETVAKLPSGVPVRLRCQEWTDDVVLRDSARGLVIERRTPRLEVVPVSLETF